MTESEAGPRCTVIIVGGGAAGLFAAVNAAEAAPHLRVVVLEKERDLLRKVAVSGGGRCNLTHDCRDPRELARHYPRGGRELLGMFNRFAVQGTIDWFAARGVPLKTEADGRMFPASENSATVTRCLIEAAGAAGVEVFTNRQLCAARRTPAGFVVEAAGMTPMHAELLLIAAGGMRGGRSSVREIAERFGHTIVEPVPSLFSMHIDDAHLGELAGLSVTDAEVGIAGRRDLRCRGPLLITHSGASGPAVLNLSAWGARQMAELDYSFELLVDWLPGFPAGQLADLIASERTAHPRRRIENTAVGELPRRLWVRLAAAAGIPAGRTWSELRREEARTLLEQIKSSRLSVGGKTLNKEEFVTCGGIALGEIDLRRMESRLVPDLFFAGEVLDIDGTSGGFNLQAAWTGGWIAAKAIAARPQRASARPTRR